jgi:hypothetical protein
MRRIAESVASKKLARLFIRYIVQLVNIAPRDLIQFNRALASLEVIETEGKDSVGKRRFCVCLSGLNALAFLSLLSLLIYMLSVNQWSLSAQLTLSPTTTHTYRIWVSQTVQ